MLATYKRAIWLAKAQNKTNHMHLWNKCYPFLKKQLVPTIAIFAPHVCLQAFSKQIAS